MLYPTSGRVLCSIDLDFKNNHTFASGLVIRHERQWNNLNKRETEPVNAIVVSSESDHIPAGAEVLIHHNAAHPVSQITNHKQLSGSDVADSVKEFSIPETQCYLWRMSGTEKWKPLPGFATALRIFQPIKTQFYGVAPNLLKNTLYITSGNLEGKVVRTLKACDYEVIFRNERGMEERVIRCRHFEDGPNDREEIIAIDHKLTKLVTEGEYYIGISVTEAKPLNEYYEKKAESKLII